jgi:DNA-binding beta-propeller fold protein YncE
MKLTTWRLLIVFSGIFYTILVSATFPNMVFAPQGSGGGGVERGTIPSLLYVLNEKLTHSTISVIDPVKRAIISTLPAGDHANDLVFVRPNYLYVTNAGVEGSVLVVDISQRAIIKKIPLGHVSPVGGIEFVPPNFVYVGARVNGPNDGRIYVINTIDDTIFQTLKFGKTGQGGPTLGPFVGPNSLYISQLSGTLSKFNIDTKTVTHTIDLGFIQQPVFVNPNLLYMLKGTSVAVLNTDTDTFIADFPPGLSTARSLAFVPPHFLYIGGQNFVSVIDTRSNSIYDGMVFLDRTGDFEFVRPNFLYLSNNYDLVRVIDTSTNTWVDAIPSGPNPQEIVSSP